MSDHAGLDVSDVTVTFEVAPVLDEVSLSVAAGDVVALLGPSGSGKSTLLRVIAGILAPDSGRIAVQGVDVTDRPTHRRGVGMVFQDNQLFPHLSVLDNVAFGPKMAGATRSDRAERAARSAPAGRPGRLRGPTRDRPVRRGGRSASHWPDRWRLSRRWCCSTNRSQDSTASSMIGWPVNWHRCCETHTSPPCWSPMTPTKRSRSPTGPSSSPTSERSAFVSCAPTAGR